MSYNTPHNEFHFLHFDHGLDMSIPRRIFQTWKTKNELSPQLDRWSNTFKSLNPTFKYDLWDDNDNRSLIATEFPWFLPIYDSYQFEICRVDAVRYFYLYTYGGVYADIDTECLRPLDGILGLADVVLGRMGNNPAFLHSIPNAIMASRPRQEFWLLVIALMQLLAREALRPEFLTGPVILKRAVDLYFNSYREDNDSVKVLIEQVGENLQDMQVPESCKTHLRVMDSSAFYPLDWNNPAHRQWRKRELNGDYLSDQIKRELCGRSWTVTYWQHSWE